MPKSLLMIAVLLVVGVMGAVDRTVLFTEDFSSNQLPPAGWSIDAHTENWTLAQTALSGGVVPELKFGWYPLFTGSSYFISPEIDTQGCSNLLLDFHQFYDYHDPGPTISVVTRSGEGPWTSVWSADPVTNIASYLNTVEISNPDVGSATFQFAFCFEGFSFNVDGWFLDDIKLYKIDTSDLLVSAAMPDSQVVAGTELAPWCRIRNQGNYPIVAKASMQIFMNDNLMESWPSFWIRTMAPQTEQRVDFPSFNASTPGAAYRIKFSVSSQEGTVDDNLSNNQMFSRINTWNTPKQKVLLELGTGIWNADLNSCYGAITGAEQFIQNGAPVAILNHMSGPPYACDDSEARLLFYNMTHLPTAVFDGHLFSEAGSSTGSVYDSYLPLYDAAAAVKAPLNMELRGAFSTGTYEFQVLFDKTAATDSLQGVLQLVLSQDSMWADWMGLTHFNHVTRDLIPDPEGNLISIPNAQTDFRFELSQFMGLDFYPGDYTLTAFLQDTRTHRVIQCVSQPMGSLLPPVESADPVQNPLLTEMSLWPNPFRNELRIQYDATGSQSTGCRIFNLKGQVVRDFDLNGHTGGKQSFTWNGKDSAGKTLPAGIYFVQLNADRQTRIQKTLLLK